MSGMNLEPMQLDTSADDMEILELSDSSTSESPNYQIDSCPFEVESYISQFSGHGKLIRLLYIIDHCPPLQIDALEQAIKHVKETTYNTNLYIKLMEKLCDIVQNDENSFSHISREIDKAWVEKQANLSQVIFEKLDTDLKNYKTNSIKESIRRGHDDLGAHHVLCGDLQSALKCYTRSRDYCMGDQNLFNICMNVLKINIYLMNWPHVHSYVQKAENAEFSSNEADKSKIHCIAGLYYLVNKQYRNAAERFIKANFDSLGHRFTEIMSLNSIAIYGGLCALATFNRDELRRKLISCSNFKMFLELEPQLREAINKFLESKYPDCLKLLNESKDAFMLDIYLAAHVKSLFSMIRNRALIQYFSPYLSADLHLMASAFNTTVSGIENELTNLILKGQIQARIDSHNKILYAQKTDPRLLTFKMVLEKGREFEMKTKSIILRTACARNGLINIHPSSGQQNKINSCHSKESNNPSNSKQSISTKMSVDCGNGDSSSSTSSSLFNNQMPSPGSVGTTSATTTISSVNSVSVPNDSQSP
ncbi:COP9 signalosome complex subunit 1 [Sarcoptes scabiei]|uniref:COP9 signalosome complex subunit 1 n=1 Tax=Sarcoptes scabiei TaxID=52283 RepID=A0A132A1N9_SARSC|nr:COP9 signalosome complex subunit 1 [Sarcoptes scabiei]KPM04260.1 COP9 signalosome complex subunit 1-like protein [Sarcoptes scabiei]